MTKEEARYLLNELEGDKKRTYGAITLNLMWPAFEATSYSAGEKAFDYLILNNNVLPVANVVIAQLERFQKELNQQSAIKAEKAEEDENRYYPNINNIKPVTRVGSDAIIGLKMIINGCNDDDLSELFQHMGNLHGDRWYKVGSDITEERKTGKLKEIRYPDQPRR